VIGTLRRAGIVAAALLAAGCALTPSNLTAVGPPSSSVGSTAPASTSSVMSSSAAPPSLAPSDASSPAPSASPPAGLAATKAAASVTATPWFPRRGATWQWQLDGKIATSVHASVFDVDVDDTSAATVAALHRLGRRVICYVDVGTSESYRADAAKFPKAVLGKAVDGWPQERWLDIRRIDLLAPILRARLDTCARKGFDAVEPDWLDAYDQATGFPITRAASIRFDLWIAREAHRRGLGVAQKNGPGLVTSLHKAFDFAITEDCFAYGECTAYRAYLAAGRAVLDAEYILEPAAYCSAARKLGVTAIRKRLALDAWRATCP
jgi:hypothetical protein